MVSEEPGTAIFTVEYNVNIETNVFLKYWCVYQNKRRHMPEVRNHDTYSRENHRSIVQKFWCFADRASQYNLSN